MALLAVQKSKSLPAPFRDSAQKKGIFITTSDFTKDANDYAANDRQPNCPDCLDSDYFENHEVHSWNVTGKF